MELSVQTCRLISFVNLLLWNGLFYLPVILAIDRIFKMGTRHSKLFLVVTDWDGRIIY